jgi:hypothetical protein
VDLSLSFFLISHLDMVLDLKLTSELKVYQMFPTITRELDNDIIVVMIRGLAWFLRRSKVLVVVVVVVVTLYRLRYEVRNGWNVAISSFLTHSIQFFFLSGLTFVMSAR